MERDILTYQDLVKIKSGENNERLVCLNEAVPEIISKYQKIDMLDYIGDKIFVRKKVAVMLAKVSADLKKKHTDFKLKVVYGYRHPDVQILYFEKKKQDIKMREPNLSEEDLRAKTHLFVAAPDVAGHVVGGALDITIADSKGDLDMGTSIADFSDQQKIQTFSSKITSEQKNNRMLLHGLMLKVGFAPFYGEWWHFSYGDKEWAAFYKHGQSLYSPIYFKV